MRLIYFFVVGFIFYACSTPTVKIIDLSKTKVGLHASSELTHYLGQLYNKTNFSLAEDENQADVQLLLSSQVAKLGTDFGDVPLIPESFKIRAFDDKLLVVAPDERGLLNGTYALLEKLGCGFYISGDVLPKPTIWKGFDGWDMDDEPLTRDRFVFNWHNFLSGCTGWNLPDWQLWIDQANKMRFNGIMVHAYGNNPMFSFKYLGEKKATGYLNNTASGRDWGNQHVNDVRRMVGGEIFDTPIFGAKASMVSEENKDKEASELMQQVFQYAEDRGTKVIFALDFDTWMSTPRNIAEELPKDALFEMYGGNLIINPEHPEGYKYYKQVVKSLLEMYPQIDQLSVWHRRPQSKPSTWSSWMSFEYSDFPEHWKKEYKAILEQNPQIEDKLEASGMFAYSKVVKAILQAGEELDTELEVSSGSWRFDFIPYADVFFPKEIRLLPLDWEVVFEREESKEILANAGKNRSMYPIIWAHHDDHRYIGRPYTPWENLSSMLQERNSKGFGIIHWTTRPLDLYFSSSARQVWETTRNEPIKTTVDKYVVDLFGTEDGQLSDYFYDWLTTGPQFGRETTDHFIDLGKQKLGHGLEPWDVMNEKTIQRLEQMKQLPGVDNSELLMYQKKMEEFYLSFFENQILFQQAYDLAAQLDIVAAQDVLSKANPDEAISKYVDAIKEIGFTPGEKAIVFSMNTRWLADFYNLEQRLGMRPVRYRFSQTQHDSLAQAPGHFSYHIDEDGAWWRCLWKNELSDNNFVSKNAESALILDDKFEFRLKTMHGQTLPNGIYNIDFIIDANQDIDNIFIEQVNLEGAPSISYEKMANQFSFNLDLRSGDTIKISGAKGMKVKGIVMSNN